MRIERSDGHFMKMDGDSGIMPFVINSERVWAWPNVVDAYFAHAGGVWLAILCCDGAPGDMVPRYMGHCWFSAGLRM